VSVGSEEIVLRDNVPRGHKFALRTIPQGREVRKYGWPIGVATSEIAAGHWVHTHNLASALSGLVPDRAAVSPPAPVNPRRGSIPDTFLGYRRAGGRVGTRNEIWILCTVGCVARTAEKIARIAADRHAGMVDGIHALTHPFGCSQLGDDLSRTRDLLAGLMGHPNCGGVLVVGLGCESNQLDALLERAAPIEPSRVRSVLAQGDGDEIERGLAAVAGLVAVASQDRREACPASSLVVGLKCGGSDAFSGITANPLVGRMADRVAQFGGTAVLTEIPEVFGAEHLLLERAVDADVRAAVLELINGFRRYFTSHGQPIHENPSPGNVAGGITTLEEKSLGAVQKGGQVPVTDALRYGESARRPGLALLEAPGNDAVSSTALVAAGANILLFTTGRGTPLGFPVPTLKIASNSDLAGRKPSWIDFDAGAVLSGVPLQQAADDLWIRLIDIASGSLARNELNEEREIAIWKHGVTL
jgi:altronate hydrolase